MSRRGSSCSPARVGSGKTTSAAGTATLAARRGERTLVLSTDAAHSLGDAFGEPIGAEPTRVADDLWVHQVDAQRRFERSWGDIQGYLMSVLDAAGVDPITAEELTVIPGAEEVLALLELRTHAVSGDWDVIIVDCAPTAETLRLLALPEALELVHDPGVRRRSAASSRRSGRCCPARPGCRCPRTRCSTPSSDCTSDLEEVQQILTEKDASVRLVLTPETVVVAEARRSLTTLSLYGYRVDGVIANRVFPAEGADEWRDALGRGAAVRAGRGAPVVRRPADLDVVVPARRAGGRRRARRRSPRRRTTAPTRWRRPPARGR